MGAGKGRNRRTSASQSGSRIASGAKKPGATSKPRRVSLKEGATGRLKWREFVQRSGVEHVKIQQYYLKMMPTRMTKLDYEQVLTGLFADLVNVGAISLPEGSNVDDFTFKMGSQERDSDIFISVKDKPTIRIPLRLAPYYYLDASKYMSSPAVSHYMRRIMGSVVTLVEQEHDPNASVQNVTSGW